VIESKELEQIEIMQKEKEYWVEKLEQADLENEMLPLDIITDKFSKGEIEVEIKDSINNMFNMAFKGNALMEYIMGVTSVVIMFHELFNKENVNLIVPVIRNKDIFDNKYILINSSINKEMTLKQILNSVKSSISEGHKNQHVILDEILERKEFKEYKENILECVFSYNMIHKKEDYIKGRKINFNFLKDNNKLKLKIEYNSEELYEDKVSAIARTIEKIIGELLVNRDEKLKNISLITDFDKSVLRNINNNTSAYPKDMNIVEAFKESVLNYGDSIAIEYGEEKLTYKELDVISNKLANYLNTREKVESSDYVGILMNKSLDVAIAALAVLKVGKAYIPLNPENPEDKQKDIIEDAGLSFIIGTEEFKEELLSLKDNCKGDLSFLYSREVYSDCEDELIFTSNITSDSKAYVIYTSGTTGKSKGVIVDHHNVINLILNEEIPYQFGNADVWTMFHSYCFDFSIWEMYGALLTGGKLLIISREISRDTEKFYDVLLKNEVTVLNQTPGAFYNLIEVDKQHEDKNLNLRYVIFGGEALNISKLKEFMLHHKNTTLVNMYGITETTVHVTFKEIEEKDTESKISNIGKPLPNYRVLVVNGYSKELPVGIPGELIVSGEGVSKGYLNREELTKKKFVFRKELGERTYLTGDLAAIMSQGEISYLGRIDAQIKIRGHRIEIGEVENAILKNKKVRDTVVVPVVIGENSTELCCYYCSENPLAISDFYEYLEEKLPGYSIPAYYVHIDSIPLNKNGKIDKKNLPSPLENMYKEIEYVEAETKFEKVLLKEWQDILGIEKISVLDNFFMIGGNSLNAMILSTRIVKKHNIKIPLGKIFENPTIKSLAKFMEDSKEVNLNTITKGERKELYPLSSAQRRMYFLYEFDKTSLAYNMPIVLKVKGNLDEKKIEDTFKKLTERHEILRTSFIRVDNEIMQKISEEAVIDFEIVNEKLSKEDFVKPFDLEKAPLMRVKLQRIRDNENILFIDMHHIISDGVSMNIIINEFSKIYMGDELEPLDISYADYCQWLESLDLEKEKEYWLNEFKGEIPVLELPLDFNRPQVQDNRGNNLEVIISKDIKEKIKTLSMESKTSEFMILISTMALLLGRYSRQDDIIIGTPISGRVDGNIENVVGLFVNSLAMRFNIDNQKEYIDYLSEVKEKCLKAFENEMYPFDELVEQLDINRDLSRNPLFDVMFVMQNMGKKDFAINDLSFEEVTEDSVVSKFDLTFVVEDRADEYVLCAEYSTALFREETINYLLKHYVNLLDSIVNNVHLKIADLSIIDSEEETLLESFNKTEVDYNANTNIIELFEMQVEKTPLNIALECGNKKVTYKELNNNINNLSMKLEREGVKKGTCVAILADRSIEMVTAIYAILKLAAVYVPIDKKYPKNRVEYLIRESECEIILGDAIEDFNYEVNDIIKVLPLSNDTSEEIENKQVEINGEDTAYIIFTSGTTGNPKGVEMMHSNLLNLVSHMQSCYPVKNRDAFLFKSAFTFDASISELFGWFLDGGRLVILEKDGEKDPAIIADTIDKYKVTHINFVPSMLRIFLNTLKDEDKGKLESLKYAFAGGEVFSSDFYKLAEEKCPKTKIGNFYGPTETCVYAAGYMKKDDENYEKVPIGKPLGNVKIYLINQNGNLCAIGEPGEICISGAGVGKGYKNRLDLTKDKFVLFNNERIYRSGDLGRYLPDGNIEYEGRIDSQVKLRGFRIETSEIEKVLRKFENIEDAIVVVHTGEKEEKCLCAYLISSQELCLNDVKENLRKELPEFMIPAYFMQIDKKPLTVNGKVDMKALPEIKEGIHSKEFIQPRSQVEKEVVEAFKKVLKIENVSVLDSFFELGGHSLNLIELINIINNKFSVQISLKEAFASQTVESIAKLINEKDKCQDIVLEKADEREYYPVTKEQLSMYLSYEINPESIGFNVPCAYLIKGKLKKEQLEKAFKDLINKHEILRTSFVKVDGKVMQKINDYSNFKIVYLENKGQTIEEVREYFVKPFNLEEDSLIRAAILNKNEEEHILFLDIHHIVVDGASIGILAKELMMAYKGIKLSPLDYQFKDYSLWREKKNALEKDKEEAYWLNKIDDTIKPLDLKTTYPRKNTVSENGDYIIEMLDKEESNSIKELLNEWNCTLFQFMMLVYYVTLSQKSGSNDMVIGAVTYGRENLKVADLIGLFIKTLPVRIALKEKISIKEFVEVIKDNVMGAIDNQGYPIDEIISKSSYKPVKGRRPLFDVAMVVQNEDLGSIIEEDISFETIGLNINVSKYDLFLEVMEDEDRIRLKLEYCTDLFDLDYVQSFKEKFISNIKVILDNPNLGTDILLDDILENYNNENFDVSDDEEIEFDF